MKQEPRRFKIQGELKKLVDEVMEDRVRWGTECDALCDKYGFKSFYITTADYFSGWRFAAFTNPTDKADLSMYRKPKSDGAYHPKVKEGKSVIEDIKAIEHCSMKSIWEHIQYQPHPFGGNGGLYKDEKLNGELLFYIYGEGFKSHPDLIELKKSEYFALIGE